MRVPPTAGPRVVSCTAMTARRPDAASRTRWTSSWPQASAKSSAVMAPRSTLRPAVQPPQDLLVPANRVGGLQHPMVLVREHHQPRGDAAQLQRGEHRQPLLEGHAMVLLAVDDEGGSLEPAGEA